MATTKTGHVAWLSIKGNVSYFFENTDLFTSAMFSICNMKSQKFLNTWLKWNCFPVERKLLCDSWLNNLLNTWVLLYHTLYLLRDCDFQLFYDILVFKFSLPASQTTKNRRASDFLCFLHFFLRKLMNIILGK